MVLAVMGLTVASMVGPLGEPAVRVSRPGGGPPEVVGRLGDAETLGGAIVVPGNAVGAGAGAGSVTVVGQESEPMAEMSFIRAGAGNQTALYTEQVLRAFGYDRSRFGYTYINPVRGRLGWWGRGGAGPESPPVDPRLEMLVRNLAPLESRFPPAPGR
ncbi:MAG: hypothetical protein K2Q09_10980 [Phycisphaerales bacterium]|nr:hypothetical protein [Phycisphaerales bacterium]